MAGFGAMEDGLIWVRATVNLAGLPLGREALVDPQDPYMAERLALGYLVRSRVEEARVEPDEEFAPPTPEPE